MKIISIPAAAAARLVPLLEELHAVHAAHQPARHRANPSEAELESWLAKMLEQPGIHALGAESPSGTLLGYLLFSVEKRPAMPVRAAETRMMLEHIAVQKAWQRMGVGKALIETMKTRAAEDGVDVIAASYAPFNSASAALMASQGLEPVLVTAEARF